MRPFHHSADSLAAPSWEVWDRYLRDEATPDEVEAIAEYFAGRAAPGGERLFRAEMHVLGGAGNVVSPETMLARVLAQTDRANGVDNERAHQRRPTATSSLRWQALSIMTVVVIGVILGGVNRWRASVTHVQSTRAYRTAAGQRGIIHLANGSTVVVAPATTVTFGETTSRVTARVTGEAYFSIVPSSSRSLIVRTTNAVVQVLGTTFTVRHYPAERTSEIGVEDGRVALRHTDAMTAGGKEVILNRGMLAHLSDSTITVASNVPAENYAGWMSGRLVFELVPMHEVVADLARAYDADIRLADSTLARALVSITVSPNTQSLTEILGVLTPVVDAHFTRSGTAFVIVPGRMQTAPHTRQHPFPLGSETQYGR